MMLKKDLLSTAAWLLAALLGLGLSGCAGTSSVVGNDVQGQDLKQLLPPLPLEAEPRTAATPHTREVSGLDTYTRGGNTVEIGDSLYLRPPEGETSFAVYELDTGGQPVLGAEVQLWVFTGPAFLAISDYDASRWQILGTGESGYNELPVTASSASPSGVIYVAVIATHEADIRIYGASITVDHPGWTLYTVDGTVGIGTGVSLFVQDGTPMMAYSGAQEYAIYLSRATVPLPDSAAQWHSMVVSTGSEISHIGTPLGAASVDGKPAVAFVERLERYVVYAYADIAEPDSLADWNTVQVFDAENNLGYQVRLAECAGTPRIIFRQSFRPAYLAASSTAQPGPGDWTVTEITTGEETASRTALTSITDLPVCCLITNLGEGNGLHVGYASVHTPAGPEDWALVPVHNWLDAGGYSALSVQTIDAQDRPVVSYIQDYWHGSLYLARPLVETPSGVDDWLRIALDSNVEETDIAVVDNRPFVIYHKEGNAEIKCAWATIAEPTASADFDFYTIQEELATEFTFVSCAAIGTTPVIAYQDPTENNLKFGYLSE